MGLQSLINLNESEWFDNLTKDSSDDEIIDALLSFLYNSQSQEYPFERAYKLFTEQDIERIVSFVQHHKIAIEYGERFSFNIPLKIEPLGNSIIKEHNSWLNYSEHKQKQKELKEKRESEAHEANLTASKASEKSAKYSQNSMIAAWIAGVPAVLSFLLSFQQYKESKNKEILVDSLSKKYTTLEGKFVIQQEALQKNKERIDSLLHYQTPKKKNSQSF